MDLRQLRRLASVRLVEVIAGVPSRERSRVASLHPRDPGQPIPSRLGIARRLPSKLYFTAPDFERQ